MTPRIAIVGAGALGGYVGGALARRGHDVTRIDPRPEQVEALQSQAKVRATFVRGLREVAQRFAPYLTKRFLISSLERMGVKEAVRYSAKWVPLAGTLLSAGLGYAPFLGAFAPAVLVPPADGRSDTPGSSRRPDRPAL